MNAIALAIAAMLAGQAAEVRLRGPVHEAFAITGESRAPRLGPQPPAPLAEAVPKVYPGPGAMWIPGYWDFDAEENDWTWVSGTWRFPPAGHAWINGYWHSAAGGWQRVPGIWYPSFAGQARLAYVAPSTIRPPMQPPPPRPARGDDPGLVFIPGEWQALGNRLQWVSGKRIGFPEGRGWTPGRIAWTPAGALPVSGHADLSPETRGWAFAPVRARPGAAIEPQWIWTARAWLEFAWRDPEGPYRLGDYHGTFWIDHGLVSALDAMRQRGDPFLEPLARKLPSAVAVEQAQYILRERSMGRQPLPPRALTRESAGIQPWLVPAKGEATPEATLKREEERLKYFEKQAKARQRLEQGIKRLPASGMIELN